MLHTSTTRRWLGVLVAVGGLALCAPAASLASQTSNFNVVSANNNVVSSNNTTSTNTAAATTLSTSSSSSAVTVTSTAVSNNTSSTTSTTTTTSTTSPSATQASTASCTAPALSQPFLSLGDSNYYALVPGQSPGNFAGTGWTLSGGAKIVTATLADGTTGSVLYLPSGASAVSPAMCVTNQYPTARMMVEAVSGTPTVSLGATYLAKSSTTNSTTSYTTAALTWGLSPVLAINPGSAQGWQLATFTFTATGSSSAYQVYNFYVDPRMVV